MNGVFFAFIAAILWGIDYAIAGQTYKKISVATSLSIEMFIGGIIFFIFNQSTIIKDIKTFKTDHKLLFLFVIGGILFNVAMYMIAKSIQVSNATIAGLIEISYPLFIILSSFLFFNENTLSLPIIIGGILIMIGVIIIGYHS